MYSQFTFLTSIPPQAPSGPTQSVADIATAYHKALSKVATALAQQQGETKVRGGANRVACTEVIIIFVMQ